MPKIHFFILFLFLFLNPFSGHAQNTRPLTYHLKNYTDENGLPQNSVKSIAVDESGYLWLATEDGLVRFDGKDFRIYNKSHSGTESNRIISILKNLDSERLYALNEFHELTPIQNGKALKSPLTYQNVFEFPNDPNGFVSVSRELPDYKLPIGLEDFFIQTTKDVFFAITKDSLTALKKDPIQISFKNDGTRGFFVLNKLLFHFDQKGFFTVFDNHKMKEVPLIGDLLKENNNDLENLRLFWNSNTKQVFIYHNNVLFEMHYTDRGLEATFLLDNFDFDEKKIVTIYHDHVHKRLFLGSQTQGLFIVQYPIFNAGMSNKKADKITSAALIPYKENVSLFANGNLLYSDGTESELPLFQRYSKNYSLAIDSENNIWTQRDTILYKLSPNGDQILERHAFPFVLFSLYIDDDEQLWIGSEGAIYSKNLRSPQLPIERVAFLKDVRYLHKQNNLLWIGTSNGLYEFHLIHKTLSPISKMMGKQVRSILSRGDQLWISTYGDGFYLYRDEQLIKMPLDRHHYLNSAHCILEDSNGFFWISTNKGLFQAFIQDLLAYSEGKVSTVFYQYYDKQLGFNSNEFNGGCQPCGNILKNGTFVFPSMIGAVQFDPLSIFPELPNNVLNIDKITIDSLEVEPRDTLYAKADFGRLEIQLSSPYFGNPNNLSFEYQLGDKSHWTSVNEEKTISFSTLPHGNHQLKIRKVNGFNEGNFEYRNVVIVVSPFFYQTWWFYLGLTAVFIAFVFSFFGIRNRNILRQNKQLEKLVINRTADLEKSVLNLQNSKKLLKDQSNFQKRLIVAITHDIKSPLKYLMITSRHLLYQDKLSAPQKASVKAIYLSASSMFHFTDNLLNYSKLFLDKKKIPRESINIKKIIVDKTTIFSEILIHNGIQVRNHIPSDLYILSETITLSVILHNLIDNAIKFTSNGTISFHTEYIETTVILSIHDTGCGMCPEILNWLNGEGSKGITEEGLGLKTVKNLASRIPLTIKAKSNLGAGTKINLIFEKNLVVSQVQNKIPLSTQLH